jgi:sugar phosphate isomerase/epimerase
MGRYPLGIVELAFLPLRGVEASVRARELGFDHFDPMLGVDPTALALPVGIPIAMAKPQAGWCVTPAPPDGAGRWEWLVDRLRASPGCLLEPWAGACVNSLETMRAIAEEVPGLRFLVDTGHVASWGGDPLEALEYADYVQLRQARPGHPQLHVDDPSGVVDFAAVIRRLDEIGYRGRISIEYFNLAQQGYPLDDPVGWSVDLAAHVRPLL